MAEGPQEDPVPQLNEAAGDYPVLPLNEAAGPRDHPVPPLNEAAGPRDHPVLPLNEAASPRDHPVPPLNEAAGPRDHPVPPLNEAAGPRDHPVPKPGVRRTRRSGEEKEEKEKEKEEKEKEEKEKEKEEKEKEKEKEETRPFKLQQTLTFLPWPRPDPIDESPTMTDRIGDQGLLAEILFLKKQVLDLSKSNETMATKMREMETDFIMSFQIVQSRLIELTQANEKLTKSKKDMVVKIQAMEVNACDFSARNACEGPRAETHPKLSQTPYSVELPRSPSSTSLPFDYDSDDSLYDNFNNDTDDSYQAKKRKRDESDSRSEATSVLSEIKDFFRRTSNQAQRTKRKRDEPEQSRPDNPNVSILESFFWTKRSFPLDEIIMVPPPSLRQVSCAPPTSAPFKSSKVVCNYWEQEKKRRKLDAPEHDKLISFSNTEQDLASNQAQGKKRKRDESDNGSIIAGVFQPKRSFLLDQTIVVPPLSLSKAPCAPSTPATLKPSEVVYDFREREKKRRKLYWLEGPEYDNPTSYSTTEQDLASPFGWWLVGEPSYSPHPPGGLFTDASLKEG